MALSACSSCRSLLRARLRIHIAELQWHRRGLHASSFQCRMPSKAAYISSAYIDTLPPAANQLAAATHFFATHAPTKSWTATEWRKHISQHSDDLNDITPEIAFLGRSNSGKSSLLNALLGVPGLCRVGPRPGKTTTMHAWTLAFNHDGPRMKKSKTIDVRPKLTVLDMPGYGHGSRSEWGQEIITYMKRRTQLRRAFILLNPKHGVKESDERILQVLRAEGIVHQIVACKCDGVKSSELADRLLDLRTAVNKTAAEDQALGLVLSDVLAVGNLGDGKANQKVYSENMRGIDNVRWAVLQATGLDEFALTQYENQIGTRDEKRPLKIIDTHTTSQPAMEQI